MLVTIPVFLVSECLDLLNLAPDFSRPSETATMTHLGSELADRRFIYSLSLSNSAFHVK